MPEVRQLVGELAAAFDDAGKRPAFFFGFLEKTSTRVPKKTLANWRRRAASGVPVISPSKKTGRAAAASAEETDVLCGYVLHQNAAHKEVSRRDGQRFLFDQFGLDVTTKTVGNMFAKADLTRRRMRLRTAGYMKGVEELADMYVAFIKEMRAVGALKGTYASADYTTTRHSTDVRYSYGPMGGGPLRNARKTTSHTNAILTFIDQDGKQLPSMNMAFRLDWGKWGTPSSCLPTTTSCTAWPRRSGARWTST